MAFTLRTVTVTIPMRGTATAVDQEVTVNVAKIETDDNDLLLFDENMRLLAGYARGEWLRFGVASQKVR